MALLLIVGPMLLPEYRDPNAGRPDLLSAALSLAAVLAMIFGLKQIAQDGLALTPVLFIARRAGAGACCSCAGSCGSPDPLLDLRLFRVPAFSASLATYGLAILFLFGGFLFLPQYLQLVLGMSPFRSGLWTLPWALSFVVGSMLTPAAGPAHPPGLRDGRRAGRSPPSASRCSRASTRTTGFCDVRARLHDLLAGHGAGVHADHRSDRRLGAARAGGRGLGHLRDQRASSAARWASPIFGSIGVAIYRAGLAGVIPDGVSAEAAEAARATLGGAIDVARELPDQAGARWPGGAGGVHARGVQLCAAISTGGAVLLAAFAALTLRQSRGSSESSGDQAAASPDVARASA